MFIKAIELAEKFTRPVYFISRNYNSDNINRGAATLFFINADGWALTCGHVTRELMVSQQINNRYNNFKKELASLIGTKKEKILIKDLEKKYKLNKNETFELYSMFINCVEGTVNFDIILHKKYDIALLKFKNYSKLTCDTFPIFPNDTSSLMQGKMLCRLGFPFPEFTNYNYDKANDKISWTNTGNASTPRFPIEGMVTRHLSDQDGMIFGIEMSTPGLKGQSGGPAFDTEGKVWGMQFATNHLDLDFDIDQEVMRKGAKKRVTDHAFLHVGHCIHVNVIKEFLNENKVTFTQG